MLDRLKDHLAIALELVERLPEFINKLFDALDVLVIRLFLWALAAYGAYSFFMRHP